MRDLRVGLRRLVREPGFSVIVVITLGLGIGATTTIFSVVEGVLLRPLPYRDAERLLTVWQWSKSKGIEEAPSPRTFSTGETRSSVSTSRRPNRTGWI
jgi:hypothetical protein